MSIKTIYTTLVHNGMTPEGACGLMGNMKAESGMKANIAQRGMTKLSDEQYTAAADNGLIDFANDAVGYGLCQWTYHTRKQRLLDYAHAKGVSVGDEAMQIEFCLKEMMQDYPVILALLMSSHSIHECAEAVCVQYERPAVNNVEARTRFAQEFYDELAGETPAPDDEELAPDACPIFPPDPSVIAIQFVMNYNGYWGTPDGQKSAQFFASLREFVNDMEHC